MYHKKNIVGNKITDRSLECVHPKNVPIDIVDKYIVYKAEIRIMLPVISLGYISRVGSTLCLLARTSVSPVTFLEITSSA